MLRAVVAIQIFVRQGLTYRSCCILITVIVELDSSKINVDELKSCI